MGRSVRRVRFPTTQTCVTVITDIEKGNDENMATKAPIYVDPEQITKPEIDAVSKAMDSLPLDSVVRRLLTSIVDASNRGAGITAFAQDSELTPNQVADALGMSRPHLLKFIRSGALKYHLVGTHQRISYEDFIDFKTRYEDASKDVSKALATDRRASSQITLSDDEMAELDDL